MTDANVWPYVSGQIVGRLLMSYLLVWLACWAFSKFDARAAFRKTKRWWGVLSVLLLFGLGLLGLAARVAGTGA